MHTPFFPSLRPVLAPMGSRSRRTLAALRPATLAQIEQSLAPALPADLLQKPAAGAHCRRRVFDQTRTFWSWLWQILQANTSCRQVVQQLQALRGLLGQSAIDPDNSAYCQARLKLPLVLLQNAFGASARSAQKAAPAPVLLQGRPLKHADGSSLRLEDSAANRRAFPPAANQFHRPAFPLLRIVVLFCLASGAVLACATGSLQLAELRLLMSLAQQLQPGDILCADRAYGQYVLLHWLQDRGSDLVARLNTRNRWVDFRRAHKKLAPGDALFLWRKPLLPSKLLTAVQWAAVPQTLLVRVIRLRVQQPGFRTRQLTLVTTLLEPDLYPAWEIALAYCKRWRLEMCLDDLKTTLGMEQLHCKSPAAVQKELLVFLTAHNLVRWLMAQAATQAGASLERLSFKGTLDAFRQWSLALTQVRGPAKRQHRQRLWRRLLQTLAADLVLERPGRREPRAVKKRSKYPRLTRPRHRYVERWSRNKRRRVARAKRKHLLN